MDNLDKPTVIDFFCGAGGFSEGFRQQGFIIENGYDKWQSAIDTYNYNFGKNKGVLLDILTLESENSIEYIEKQIPDTHVILGSPPCVSFSTSNRSGKADKSMGVRLIEVFLKVVAVKKFKRGSKLNAWFMENVTKSKDHLKDKYSFKDLGLESWAKKRRINPRKIAIVLNSNTIILNAADYGSPQIRLRAISGEIIKAGKLIPPAKLLTEEHYITLKQIKSSLPSPNSMLDHIPVIDPLYPRIVINKNQLTDHFYDTGLYEAVWLNSKYQKTNHPYMGRMSFPENEEKPSRTITATTIGTSRESLIYKSEHRRRGNGEYRAPTVREAATIMSFPITFQFLGTESVKWRLVGNAVCPSISRALASITRVQMGLRLIKAPLINLIPKLESVPNLNSNKLKTFDSPPKRNKDARFRRHPFKDGNITVTLSNYDIKDGNSLGNWITSVQYGNGEGFTHKNYPDGYYKKLESTILKFDKGNIFLEMINNGFTEKIADSIMLQKMYEEQKCINGYLEPSKLVEEVSNIIQDFNFIEPLLNQSEYFEFKTLVPKKQVLALYAINKISTLANQKIKF